MPRPSKSDAGRILDYFRHAELGEAKVVCKLAGDIVLDRFRTEIAKVPRDNSVAPAPRKTRTRKTTAAPLPMADNPTQEVA